MFPNDIDITAASIISKGNRDSMSYDCLNHLFAVNALKEIHLFLISWSLAIPTGVIGFLLSYIQSPDAKLNK